MSPSDVIRKRELEIQIIKDQLAGVSRKINNLEKTRENLATGLRRAEESLNRQKELLSQQ